MGLLSRRWRLYAVCLVIIALPLTFAACGGGEKPTIIVIEEPTIRLSDEQYDSQALNNAIVRFLIEHGYGIQTETVVTTSVGMQDLIVEGKIDLEMEGWQHNRLEWYDSAIRNQEIENLGLTYESGPQFFIIPQWMADEYNDLTPEKVWRALHGKSQ